MKLKAWSNIKNVTNYTNESVANISSYKEFFNN